MQIIGAGVGRTGTMSLRVALQELGFGPCHHMHAVLQDMPGQVPLWEAALQGRPDWDAIYAGQRSAVDWPTASFYRELHAEYPEAKFVLSHRDPDSWVDSFSETILRALSDKSQAPAEVHGWIDMCLAVIARAGFLPDMDRATLEKAYVAHFEAVKAAIPAAQLLIYRVSEGWEPLCAFLDVAIPEGEFPRTNDRAQFWELVKGDDV